MTSLSGSKRPFHSLPANQTTLLLSKCRHTRAAGEAGHEVVSVLDLIEARLQFSVNRYQQFGRESQEKTAISFASLSWR
jgi:hypothetical protein